MALKSHKSKTLYKYILTYTVTLIIPLMAFLYHINVNVITLIEQQTMDTVKGNLLRGKERTEEKFTDMQKITISIMENLQLLPHAINENYYKRQTGVKELGKYRSGNGFYYDIAYYIRGDDTVYTSYQYSSIDVFINSVYNFENWNYEDFYIDINSIKAPVLRRVDKAAGLFSTKDLIVYMCPVRKHNPYATVIFLIDNSSMKELHKGILEEQSENVYMIDSEGQLITSVNGNNMTDNYFSEHVLASLDKNLPGYSNVFMSGYIVSSVVSEDGKLQFVSVADRDRIMEKVDDIKKQIYTVFTLVFLAGVAIILIALYINYTPLHRLYKKITGKLQTGFMVKDEMAAVDMAFDQMITVIDRLYRRIESYKNDLRSYVLKELVSGNDFKSEGLGEIDLLSSEPKDYLVIVLRYPDLDNELSKKVFMQTTCEIFEKELNKNIKFYSIKNIEEDQLILILYLDEGTVQKEYLKFYLTDVLDLISRETEVKPIIGIGNTYKDILSIGQSFAEASKVIQYNMVNRDNKVVYFKEIEKIESSAKPYTYPYDELTKLTAQLRSGSIENAGETLGKLTRTMLKKDIPEFIIRCIVFDIFNMLIKASIEMNISLSSVMHNYLRSITSSKQSISSLFSILDIAYREFCTQVKNEPCYNPLLDKIMSYTQANFQDYNFSIREMASHLGITVPYLSQYFKDNTGENLTEYIWKLRIKAAKYMFVNTQLSVNEIVKSIGYIDASSFCRRFKNEAGITPGAYIKKYREKHQTSMVKNLAPTERSH